VDLAGPEVKTGQPTLEWNGAGLKKGVSPPQKGKDERESSPLFRKAHVPKPRVRKET